MKIKTKKLKEKQGIHTMSFLYNTFLLLVVTVSVGFTEVRRKTTVSVYGMKSLGISQSLAISLQEHLESQILKYDCYEVMSRSDMDVILKESRFQQTGMCAEEECLVEAGHILGVEKIITGTISMIGITYNIVLKLIDVNTAKLESSVSNKHSGSQDSLLDIIEVSLQVLIDEERAHALEKEKQYKRNLTEKAYKKHIEKLKNELAGLKQKNAQLYEHYQEERKNLRELKKLNKSSQTHAVQSRSTQKNNPIQSTVTAVGISKEKQSNHPGTENSVSNANDIVKSRSKKIGFGALVILAIVCISITVSQIMESN